MDALVNVAFPVFGIVVSGWLAGRFNVLGPDSAAALNRFVYYFALGLSLAAQNLGGDHAEVAWLVALKMIVHPAITWALVTWVFDMPAMWSKAAIILSALPVGALVFVIAQQYDVYVRRASTAIVASTALSIGTISALPILLGVN